MGLKGTKYNLLYIDDSFKRFDFRTVYFVIHFCDFIRSSQQIQNKNGCLL